MSSISDAKKEWKKEREREREREKKKNGPCPVSMHRPGPRRTDSPRPQAIVGRTSSSSSSTSLLGFIRLSVFLSLSLFLSVSSVFRPRALSSSSSSSSSSPSLSSSSPSSLRCPRRAPSPSGALAYLMSSSKPSWHRPAKTFALSLVSHSV